MTAQCFLKFQSFSIEGLSSKLNDDSFIDGLKRFDFITLVETWLSPKANINIDGYYCYKLNKARIKAKTARRYSGGISVLVTKSLRKGVKFISSESSEFVWWKLEKAFFDLEEDIYICCSVYIPPVNSKHFGQNENDPYDDLQSELMHYSKLGRIMLMGDFNARKSLLSDSLGGSINL